MIYTCFFCTVYLLALCTSAAIILENIHKDFLIAFSKVPSDKMCISQIGIALKKRAKLLLFSEIRKFPLKITAFFLSAWHGVGALALRFVLEWAVSLLFELLYRMPLCTLVCVFSI